MRCLNVSICLRLPIRIIRTMLLHSVKGFITLFLALGEASNPKRFLSSDIAELEKETILASCQNIVQNYESFKQRGRDGELGETAKLWVMYLDLMKYQQMAHTAVQESDLEMRIHAWDSMLPYYFYLNKTNYVRYGTYYVQKLYHLETLYPGMKSLLEGKGISVQAQNSHFLQTSIDQRGEQTINRGAKTTGRKYGFAVHRHFITADWINFNVIICHSTSFL